MPIFSSFLCCSTNVHELFLFFLYFMNVFAFYLHLNFVDVSILCHTLVISYCFCYILVWVEFSITYTIELPIHFYITRTFLIEHNPHNVFLLDYTVLIRLVLFAESLFPERKLDLCFTLAAACFRQRFMLLSRKSYWVQNPM